MGDCAIVIFHSKKQNDVSPAVYLHSHGGCVLVLLETAMPQMRSEPSYACARFIGRCHEVIPGMLGLGVENLPGVAEDVASRRTPEHYERMLANAKEFDYGGRGIFLVDVDEWRVEHFGSTETDYGDTGDGFDMQEETELESVNGVVQLPAPARGTD